MKNQDTTVHRPASLRTPIWALATLLAVQLWIVGTRPDSAASAQVPDTALQRKQQLDEQRRTNELLTQILDHLRSKPVKVELSPPDKDGGVAPRPQRR